MPGARQMRLLGWDGQQQQQWGRKAVGLLGLYLSKFAVWAVSPPLTHTRNYNPPPPPCCHTLHAGS